MRMKLRAFLIAALSAPFVTLSEAAAQELCNCYEWSIQGSWRHEFDSQAVDWGFNNGHEWQEGGKCFDFHTPWFCSGMAESIIESSPGWDAVDALTAFAYRVDKLSTAPAGVVAAFISQFEELAYLDGDQIVLKSCNGPIAIRIIANAGDITKALDM